jgi:hypothetical protein
MTRDFFLVTLTMLLPLAFPDAARADEAPQGACAAQVAPTGELAPWSSPLSLTAGKEMREQPMLEVGKAANVTLRQTPKVRYPLRPEKPGGSVSYGGLIGVDIAEAGNYRVALGSGAWIDMVKQGQAAATVAHGHGPACTGVRKMVDFALTPGRYTLQLGANGEAHTTVLVARLP